MSNSKQNNFNKYRLELQLLANNLSNHYGQSPKHIISNDFKKAYKSIKPILLRENWVFDQMGDDDLLNYEKWLVDGEFL